MTRRVIPIREIAPPCDVEPADAEAARGLCSIVFPAPPGEVLNTPAMWSWRTQKIDPHGTRIRFSPPLRSAP